MRVSLKVNPFLLLSILFCVQIVFTQTVWADWQPHQIRQGDGSHGQPVNPDRIVVQARIQKAMRRFDFVEKEEWFDERTPRHQPSERCRR